MMKAKRTMAETGEVHCAVMFTATSLPILGDGALLLAVIAQKTDHRV